MSLADSMSAIGAVSQLLADQIKALSGNMLPVSIGYPDSQSSVGPRINLFLYEIVFDATLKNYPLDEGQAPPLWLVLKFLLTSFDGNSCDTVNAHINLGKAMSYLQTMSFLPISSWQPASNSTLRLYEALSSNPEPLKLTFDEVTPDLLSKVMPGNNDPYRFSIGFQIRPVMIATGEDATNSLLVGYDYTDPTRPPVLQNDYHTVNAAPNLEPLVPTLTAITGPYKNTRFQPGDSITLQGTNLRNVPPDVVGLTVQLGPLSFSATPGPDPTVLTLSLARTRFVGEAISAGAVSLYVTWSDHLANSYQSDSLIGALLPLLDSVQASTQSSGGISTGTITLSGTLLGADGDNVLVSLFQNGKVVKTYQNLPNPGTASQPAGTRPPQTSMVVTIAARDEILSGKYRVILRVNGQQAINSPEVMI